MKLINTILNTKLSCLVIEERLNRDIVVGVPHHAPAGVSNLPCPEHTTSDENTGYLGRYIGEKLNCCSIIACNYTIDINKKITSDYAIQTIKWKPKLFIEIHGQWRKRTNNDVEISCGSLEENEYSCKLAEKLHEKCQQNDGLKWLKISGDFNDIYFKATSVKTITHEKWLAFQVELPPELRLEKGQEGGEPPKIGYVFCDYLIESLKEIRESWDHL